MNDWEKEKQKNGEDKGKDQKGKKQQHELATVGRIKTPFLYKILPIFLSTWHTPITFAFLPTGSVLNAPTVWLRKLQFSVNLLEKDHAKHSTPFPINDAALGRKVVNDYQEGCFISQDEVYTASVSQSRIDNYLDPI